MGTCSNHAQVSGDPKAKAGGAERGYCCHLALKRLGVLPEEPEEEGLQHPDKSVCHHDPDLDKLVKTEQDGRFIRATGRPDHKSRSIPSGG